MNGGEKGRKLAPETQTHNGGGDAGAAKLTLLFGLGPEGVKRKGTGD